MEKDSFLTNYRVALPRSTMKDWYDQSKREYEIIVERGISADEIMKKTDMIRENIAEVILINKKETERRLQERISDILQTKFELENVSAALQSEIEILNLLRERIRDGTKMIRTKALALREKCMIIRQGRCGIDLTHDEVEKELEAEEKMAKGAEKILEKLYQQGEETMRLLRASLYSVGKDIEDKSRVLSIEYDCLNTKETSMNLSDYKGGIPMDISNVTVEEWERYTKEIMDCSWKKIHSARKFKIHVNATLKEVIQDLRKQNEAVNGALLRRISETKDAKARLQIQHFEITRQVNKMNQNISETEACIREKEAFLALAHTRLEKRANRKGIELIKDEAEATLVKEVFHIKQLIGSLENMLEKAKISLRTLLQTQLDLEKAINIKTRSLKIDEVDCMAVRQGIEYHDI